MTIPDSSIPKGAILHKSTYPVREFKCRNKSGLEAGFSSHWLTIEARSSAEAAEKYAELLNAAGGNCTKVEVKYNGVIVDRTPFP